jgi:predicted glycoside hydrolase/deacetylase ChbG (UPF0249 family)
LGAVHSPPVSGLLIVNADDWGASRDTTERIGDCFTAGGVSSATAMVHMADSERAAARALELGLSTGLHLNLTQPFDGLHVPGSVRETQRTLAAHFGRLRRGDRVLSDPRLLPDVRQCVAEQLACFRALYGREPTHVDGHNHVHLNPIVLAVLPRRMSVRTALHEERIASVQDIPRMLRHRMIRAWHGSPEFFFALTNLHPRFGGDGIEQRLSLAHEHSVELMTHPGREIEHEFLRSSEWVALLDGLRLGSFEDLG